MPGEPLFAADAKKRFGYSPEQPNQEVLYDVNYVFLKFLMQRYGFLFNYAIGKSLFVAKTFDGFYEKKYRKPFYPLKKI